MTRTAEHRRAQQGAASLVVVMVLFFIIALVAAYTNRNLIFEQRTSANQYRSTQALEAADAGLEWALALLNHGRIDATCKSSTLVTDKSFRERYIVTGPVDGKLTPRAQPGTGAPHLPSCVLNGTQWDCSCPDDADPHLTPPPGPGAAPAFRVRFEQIGADPVTGPPTVPGVIRVQAVGCTRLDAGCLAFDGQGVTNEGRATVSTLIALTGNAASPPAAALMARGAINAGGGLTLAAYNPADATVPACGVVPALCTGTVLQAGGAINPIGLSLGSAPGTPVSSAVVIDGDPGLALPAFGTFSTRDRMFAAVFNLRPTTFQQQPAAIVLTCPAGTCSADQVRDAVALNPGRPIWVDGALAVGSAGDIGSATSPVLLVVDGDLQFTVPGVIVYGLVYLRPTTWTTAGSGRVQGAIVAEGNVGGSGAPTVLYDPDVLNRLRVSTGSFVRVPGSWRDFR